MFMSNLLKRIPAVSGYYQPKNDRANDQNQGSKRNNA
jgi:hypothetical protein